MTRPGSGCSRGWCWPVSTRVVRSSGVFFAPDPSSENHCSIGGMIGTNASGARTVAYGATKDHVLALELVMADGSLYAAEPLAGEDGPLEAFLGDDTLAGRAFSTVLSELARNGTS